MACDFFKKLFPGTTTEEVKKSVMSKTEVWRDFAGIHNLGPEDAWYHFPDDVYYFHQWSIEARGLCPAYESNTETEQGFDCDDFALFFAAFCRQKGYSNAVWPVWGDSPGGYHAWNVVQCADGKYSIEPQTGEVWPFGSEPGYSPETILSGTVVVQ